MSTGSLNKLYKIYTLTVLCCFSLNVNAQHDTLDIYELSLEELMNVSVYSASKRAQKLGEAPAIMTLVTKADIDKMAVSTLVDVLRFVPGIEVSLAPDGYYRLSIRGNRKDGNVLLVVNEQPLNDFYTGRAIMDLPSMMIEKVEVIRGPGSALFGTNAVAGVVHVFLSEDNFVRVLGGLNNSVGAHFNYKHEKNENKVVVQAGYLQEEAGKATIETDAGNFQGNTWDLTYDSLRYATTRTKQDAYLNLSLQVDHLKIYTHSILRERSDWAGAQFVVAPSSSYQISQHGFGVSYDYLATEKVTFTQRLYASIIGRKNNIQETPSNYLSNFSNDLFTEGRQTKESYIAKSYGAALDIHIKVNKHLSILTGNIYESLALDNYDIKRNYKIVGDSYMGEFGNYDNVPTLQKGKERVVFAYFLQADYTWEKLNVTLGLRYDDYSDFGASFNPRLGICYGLNEHWRIKGLFGKAFRAPTFQELYDNTTIGNQYGVSGNPALKPEIIQTFEMGLEYQHKFMLLRYNAYYTDNTNLIRVYDPHGGGSIGMFQNIGSTSTCGHELEILVDLGKKVQFNANFSQFLSLFRWNADAVNQADVIFYEHQRAYYKQMFNIPTILVNLGFTAKLYKNRFIVFSGFQLANAAANNNRFYLEKGSFVAIPAYAQGNFMLSYRPKDRWTFKVMANGIGTKYVDPEESTNIDVYGTKGLIQPGMKVLGSVQFNFK